MTIFLERVPLEIRNQIYEEILISKENAIRLRIQETPDRQYDKIHSAVLRTCKQIYHEASIVLFEHNRFRFASYTPSWLGFLRNDPSYKNLKRIQHLDLVHCGELRGSPYQESGGRYHGFVDKLTTIMMFLANAGCSLQVLRLQYCFYETALPFQDVIRYRNYSRPLWLYPDSILKPTYARHVQDKIDHTLNRFREEYRHTMEEFTNRVNMAKERALTVDIEKGSIKEDGAFLDIWTKFGQIDSQFDSRHIEETHYYRWTWTLRPLTSVTKRFPTP